MARMDATSSDFRLSDREHTSHLEDVNMKVQRAKGQKHVESTAFVEPRRAGGVAQTS